MYHRSLVDVDLKVVDEVGKEDCWGKANTQTSSFIQIVVDICLPNCSSSWLYPEKDEQSVLHCHPLPIHENVVVYAIT